MPQHPPRRMARAGAVLTFVVAAASMMLGNVRHAPAERSAALANVQTDDRLPAYRRLAPGVLTVVPPAGEPADTHIRRPLSGLLARAGKQLDYTPKFLPASETLKEMATHVDFRRTIWGLEFSFKPVRMIEVPLRDGSGRGATSQVWYLLFRVRDVGRHLRPVHREGRPDEIAYVDDLENPLVFVPRFELFSHEFRKCYADQILPAAVELIQRREDPERRIYNTAELASVTIPRSTDEVDRGVWGVATWDGTRVLDPRIDFFSIFVHGLTNAYRWDENTAEITPVSHTRSKALQINFWRPGDEVDPSEREVRLGVPSGEEARYGLASPVDYAWVYVPPCR